MAVSQVPCGCSTPPPAIPMPGTKNSPTPRPGAGLLMFMPATRVRGRRGSTCPAYTRLVRRGSGSGPAGNEVWRADQRDGQSGGICAGAITARPNVSATRATLRPAASKPRSPGRACRRPRPGPRAGRPGRGTRRRRPRLPRSRPTRRPATTWSAAPAPGGRRPAAACRRPGPAGPARAEPRRRAARRCQGHGDRHDLRPGAAVGGAG